ncbi:MAG: hypothetical protein HY074_03205 [Deltaproteobacteria bacterium]|nr:hypothetical protein [Deltaproteobacteria bacterium]
MVVVDHDIGARGKALGTLTPLFALAAEDPGHGLVVPWFRIQPLVPICGAVAGFPEMRVIFGRKSRADGKVLPIQGQVRALIGPNTSQLSVIIDAFFDDGSKVRQAVLMARAIDRFQLFVVKLDLARRKPGEILAMSCRPTFDPNRPGDAAADARRNRAISDVAEPGSTFKVPPAQSPSQADSSLPPLDFQSTGETNASVFQASTASLPTVVAPMA